ncbi:unnamed protein product [Prorocentrum cordatum]|uniref:Reverse transcriptase domain-containing protein n=1 Tax=Prorocentrum cordatum TaxID=2364126 RepID=A0ABN9Q7Y7_9DINO|nr:unnamed protein product [Polarella glacialis]
MHEAPRILEVGVFASDLIPTGCGVLPGCSQSMPWIKIYLYGLLDFAHVHYKPICFRAYVDDITMTQQVTQSEILQSILPAAAHLCRVLEAAGTIISDQSAFACSDRDLKDELPFQFQTAGLPIRPDEKVRDLGVMTTAG